MLTTDIRSLPEINNESCGFICHLPQNESREAYYRTEEEREVLKKVLSEQLAVQMKEVLDSSSEVLMQKALHSWERIRTKHDPVAYSDTLKNIFIKR